MTAPTDSRLGAGTLTLGTTDFGAQVSNVLLSPNHDKQDGTPTLGDPTPAKTVTTTWVLKGSLIQDWTLSGGAVEYLRANNGESVAFSWVPNTDSGVTYSGTVTVYAVEIGGDVASQNSSTFEFDVVGDLSRADGSAVPSVPRNVTAAAESATVVVVDWDVPASGSPTSYKVYQASTLGGSYTEVTGGSITKTGTTARITGLTTATTYFYKVAAVNGSGTGSQSEAVSVHIGEAGHAQVLANTR